MTKETAFLVDQFILEVGEGRMPRVGSPEREAYEEFRKEESAKAWASERLLSIRAHLAAASNTQEHQWSVGRSKPYLLDYTE